MGTTIQFNPAQHVNAGHAGTKTLLEVQKEFLNACNEAGQAWFERAKAERHLWSDLAMRLGEAQTLQEELGAFQHSFAERLKLAVEDGQRLVDEGRKLAGAVSHAVSTSWMNTNSNKPTVN